MPPEAWALLVILGFLWCLWFLNWLMDRLIETTRPPEKCPCCESFETKQTYTLGGAEFWKCECCWYEWYILPPR